MEFELNRQQKIAIEKAMEWWNKKTTQVFNLSGMAGTGKTTIVKYLIQKIGLTEEEVLYTAYVGKACMVLCRNGHKAKTIHSSIYDAFYVPARDEEGNIIKRDGKNIYKLEFILKESLGSDIKLIVLDEASMVNKTLAIDLLSFDIPIIALGDLNQLPPVFGEPFFLKKPDVVLTEIMRQNKENPIIMLSQLAIYGEKIKYGKYGDKCIIIDEDMLNDKIITSADVMICGKNHTRDKFNYYIRNEIYKITKPYPVKGEKLICRKNNWDLSINENIFLTNGLIGYVEDVYLDTYKKNSIEIDFRPEFLNFDCFENVKIDYKYLFQSYDEKRKSIKFKSDINKFEFGYVITAHLAQGSQYNNVLIYNERFGNKEFYNKWLYTAITRAVNKLILIK